MKQYNEVEIVINIFEQIDVLTASGPDGDNTLPWVDVTASF